MSTISENVRNLSADRMELFNNSKLRSLESLNRLIRVSHTEQSALENPCTDILDDFQPILHHYGINEEDVRQITAAYDQLRLARRKSTLMFPLNNDADVAKYF